MAKDGRFWLIFSYSLTIWDLSFGDLLAASSRLLEVY